MTASKDLFTTLWLLGTLLTVPGVYGQLECAIEDPSGLQWDVFYGPRYNLVSQFCKQQSQDEANSLSWKVDINGNELSPLQDRSPPVTPSTYKEYGVQLSWTPQASFVTGSCSRSCAKTYQDTAQSYCGHTGGEGNSMAKNGTWDIGCGRYSWSITEVNHSPPTTASEPSQPHCTSTPSCQVATDMWCSSVLHQS
ncbi:uncharacterized protein CCOS01_16577 [Colletotrichum costaricense]|uniref:Uncharacterized protein n=1 Tax=Colletotrichum costaricense TaxID=1209916 RepID=A0AAJ0DSB6_9PEZI|nr:uncharacterized protein CCOS01_16577 [Colletotrichum costaricense]KAK1506525.1 hypothetical protein CCOS01_16577 [Colletotrichum costaricense]